jgi:hypothetical protein
MWQPKFRIFLKSVFALLHRNRRIPDRTMGADKDGGRSSATPKGRPPAPHQSEARGARPSIGSLFRGPQRKRPAHFPSVTVEFRSIIILLTVCTRHRKPLLANDEAAQLILKVMADSELLACRSLCYHAGSHPFILRAKHVSAATFEEVD